MGTTFLVKVVEQEGMDLASLARGVHAALDSVNSSLSTYREDSELSRFNRYGEPAWFPVSPECVAVVRQALEISAASGGAFDVTVGPLVNLWGFGPEDRPRQVPEDREIEERRAAVGWEKVSVRVSPPALKKSHPELYCDLSALAKGYGVDKVAEYLEACGVENYMVEVGGEVRTRGRNHQGIPWRIGVEKPGGPRAVQKVAQISGYALATSGDYRNYFEKDGIRYSHTIDPRTGRPITHRLASVTVIHRSCMVADGMATAITVLGPDAGYEFAVRQKLPALLLVRSGDRFTEKMTPGFAEFLR
jgi:thiamine biosynthesis lipoprotein